MGTVNIRDDRRMDYCGFIEIRNKGRGLILGRKKMSLVIDVAMSERFLN